MENTNPAGRLHEILKAAKIYVANAQNMPAAKLWAAVFGIGEENGFEFRVIDRLLQLNKLIAETEEALHAVDGITEKYFRPFDRIRTIPQRSLIALSSDIRSEILAINDGHMTVLEFCSEKLESQHAEPVINGDDLKAVIEEVNLLFDEVRALETLDEDLQSFILDGLESIRRGVYEFRIRGPKRLKETIAEIIGSVAVNHEIVKAAGTEPHLQKFRSAFNHLAAVVAFASDSVNSLTAFTGPLMPGG
jgi:hypothetical protein